MNGAPEGSLLLHVEGLIVAATGRRGLLGPAPAARAVDRLTLRLGRGEAVALVGEPGSGKTALAEALLGLRPIAAGRILFEGIDLASLPGRARRRMRRRLQFVPQEAEASFDPALPLGDALAEPIRAHGIEPDPDRLAARVRGLLSACDLDPALAQRRPATLDAEGRRRAALARALAPEPDLVIADDPVGRLDAPAQARLIALYRRAAREGLRSFLFLGRDLASARHLADRLGVLCLGRMVEFGAPAQLCESPRHPLTQALLDAAPAPEIAAARLSHRPALATDAPGPAGRPAGCPFHPRCPKAFERCREEEPAPVSLSSRLDPQAARIVACHLVAGP